MCQSRALLAPHDPLSEEIGYDLQLRRPLRVDRPEATFAVCVPPVLPLGRPRQHRPPGDAGLVEKSSGVAVPLHHAAKWKCH
jgi:hypothetical protein